MLNMSKSSKHVSTIGKAETQKTLNRLKKRLLLSSSDSLASESKALYELIEHTLLNELGGNHGRAQEQENREGS